MIRANRTVVQSPYRDERRNVTKEPLVESGGGVVRSGRDGRARDRSASGRRVVPNGGAGGRTESVVDLRRWR